MDNVEFPEYWKRTNRDSWWWEDPTGFLRAEARQCECESPDDLPFAADITIWHQYGVFLKTVEADSPGALEQEVVKFLGTLQLAAARMVIEHVCVN